MDTEENLAPDLDWMVYIIQADDTSWYTGITNDFAARWQKHLSGKGAKFFRGRKPEKLHYLEKGHNRSSASRREAVIKKLSRTQKLLLTGEVTV